MDELLSGMSMQPWFFKQVTKVYWSTQKIKIMILPTASFNSDL
jgi:hypothetical protein